MSSNSWTAPEIDPITLGDSFYISGSNPTANVDQRDMETVAMEVLETPEIRRATEAAAQVFKAFAGPDVPSEAWPGFEERMKEWAFHYVLIAMNSDPNNPMVLNHAYGVPHEWFGMKVSGGRGPGTGENVDNNYCFIPVDGHSRYELHGRRMDPATGDSPTHVIGNLAMSANIDSLMLRDTEIDPDGTFVITIGPEPADGRPNHLQTRVDARFISIRDCRTDWRQVPNAYRIRRLDPPLAQPLSVDQKAALARSWIVDDAAMGCWFIRMASLAPDNTVTKPRSSDFIGGMPSQRVSIGTFNLADDEAFVLTVGPEGAGYHSVVLHDFWIMSLDWWNRTSTLNNSQAIANDDGSYTYVISIRDPGVHNWLDPAGLRHTRACLRWQLLPRNPDGTTTAEPWTSGRVVKLDDLDSVLPPETTRVTPIERKQQLERRSAEFASRFHDS